MPKRTWDDDLMAEHKEYTEHLWNRYYWVNRIPLGLISGWRWVRRNNRAVGLIWLLMISIPVGVLLNEIFRSPKGISSYFLSGKFLREDPFIWFYAVLITAISLRLISLPPAPYYPRETPPSVRAKPENHKKRLPKRRKDYH